MDIIDISKERDIVPPYLDNRHLPPDEQLYFTVTGISDLDQEALDAAARIDTRSHAVDECEKRNQQRIHDLVKGKVKAIHYPGGRIVEFEEFRRTAPREIVTWLYAVLNSGEMLTRSERKNFLPPSGIPST